MVGVAFSYLTIVLRICTLQRPEPEANRDGSPRVF